jgi:hypothetical protein
MTRPARSAAPADVKLDIHDKSTDAIAGAATVAWLKTVRGPERFGHD